jgi:hypothetical protein
MLYSYPAIEKTQKNIITRKKTEDINPKINNHQRAILVKNGGSRRAGRARDAVFTTLFMGPFR